MAVGVGVAVGMAVGVGTAVGVADETGAAVGVGPLEEVGAGATVEAASVALVAAGSCPPQAIAKSVNNARTLAIAHALLMSFPAGGSGIEAMDLSN